MIQTGLDNRVVVITGGAQGIGKATALLFAREHARVAVWDVNEDLGNALVSDLKGAGAHDARFFAVNVTEAASIETAVSTLIADWGSIDVLINNAGILRDQQLVKFKDGEMTGMMSDEAFDAVISVNLRGAFLCARAIVPHMIRAGRGVILSASSVVALYGNFGQTNYLASKAGIIAMTKGWARELGRYGIRANAVAPGLIGTDILNSMPGKTLDAMKAHTPLGRLGEPNEIAQAYLWLASDAASFVSGTVLSVDGGLVTGT